MSSMKQSAESKPCSPSSEDTNDSGKLVGRVTVKNMNVRRRIFAGADWDNSQMTDGHFGIICWRDTAICWNLLYVGLNVSMTSIQLVDFVGLSFLSLHRMPFMMEAKTHHLDQ
ncbi:hypothetical protein EUGRSUZ_I01407 [Eucalyptus grandis]|uniref:Uncharacterized protein n=2 Tax=Eucalyptus grandis TaxID=71139 RepID=A0ACC3JF59_EUCGR|nr:hypothetical protein EUGRSUZ_I01407 [Eucalyptus grandis]